MGGNHSSQQSKSLARDAYKKEHPRSQSSNHIAISNKKGSKNDQKRQAELESQLGGIGRNNSTNNNSQTRKAPREPQSVMNFNQYPEIQVQNVHGSFNQLNGEINRKVYHNNSMDFSGSSNSSSHSFSQSPKLLNSTTMTKPQKRTTSNLTPSKESSVGRMIVQAKDRCCISCKQSKPTKCWRQHMREELLKKASFSGYAWYASLMKELDGQKEDEQEKIFVAQLTYLNSQDESNICLNRETLMQ